MAVVRRNPVAIPFSLAHHVRMASDWEREVAGFFHANRSKKKRCEEYEYGSNKIAQAILERIERNKKGR